MCVPEETQPAKGEKWATEMRKRKRKKGESEKDVVGWKGNLRLRCKGQKRGGERKTVGGPSSPRAAA